jgi:hypothetical protein
MESLTTGRKIKRIKTTNILARLTHVQFQFMTLKFLRFVWELTFMIAPQARGSTHAT